MSAEAPRPEVSLVILTHRRPGALRRLLSSLPSDAPGCEGLVLLNGASGVEPVLRRRLARRLPWVRAVTIPEQPRGAARNRAVRETSGRLIFFLDDDTMLPPGFVPRLLDAARRHADAPALGGPNLSIPGSSPFQRAVDFVLRSPLGAGPMRVRYMPLGDERRAPAWTLMLCNLGVRRDVFEAHGLLFPDRCASAEENLLLSRVERRLGRPAYCPSLAVFHERRRSWLGFGEQVFRSGQGRAQITRLDPRSWLPASLGPLALAAYAAALPWLWRLSPAALIPGALYAAAVACESARAAVGDPAAALLLPLLLPWAHACYAAGAARGLLEAALGRPTARALAGEAAATP